MDPDGAPPQRAWWPADRDGQLLLAAAQLTLDALHDRPRRHVPLADGGVQRVEVRIAHRLDDVRERRRARQFLDRKAVLTERLHELVAARLDRVLAPLPREPLTDLAASPRRLHELEPVSARARAFDLAREDLDAVARRERRVERNETAVHLGADATVTDLGVNGIREVDRRRARGQGDDLALGREDEHLVLLEVDLERLHELARVGGLLLPVDHPLEPDHVLGGRLLLLVPPVSGDAVLGATVHLFRPDLHLDELSLR